MNAIEVTAFSIAFAGPGVPGGYADLPSTAENYAVRVYDKLGIYRSDPTCTS